MENQFGKLSRLQIGAAFDGEKTVLQDVHFTAPFKVMRPFYEKPGIMTVMLLSASAGIMAGDRQEFDFEVKPGASLEFVSQAYEKIHRMEEGEAKRNVEIHVREGASFYYTPLPTVPFAGSAFSNDAKIYLADGSSRFIMSEVLACGRAARGERFQFRHFKNHVSIWQGSRRIYRDNTCCLPKEWDMEGFGLFEGYSHLANLVICNQPVNQAQVSAMRQLMEDVPEMEGGVTQNGESLTVIRILGNTAQKLTDIIKKILDTAMLV